jgi:hypothetical protein
MDNAAKGHALIDRLERVGEGKRVTRAELDDLAAYFGEVQGWANELECKMGDFAANAEMLGNPGLRDERTGLREQMIADAEATAGALRAIGTYLS